MEIVAELDRDGLWGDGARSALVAWKMGCRSGNAHTIATVARRLPEFPRCARGMREGRLSLDQVGGDRGRAEGLDAHYAQLAGALPRRISCGPRLLEPRPEPETGFSAGTAAPITRALMSSSVVGESSLHVEAAKFDAALQSHLTR